jgi:c-di-GMP-related signal transduction protein
MCEKFITRQPLFDDWLKLFAYQLLCRAGSETYERADWPALAGAAARLAQIENAIRDCYEVAATRAALPF